MVSLTNACNSNVYINYQQRHNQTPHSKLNPHYIMQELGFGLSRSPFAPGAAPYLLFLVCTLFVSLNVRT